MMTTSGADRFDSSGENCSSDSSDCYSSDEDLGEVQQPWTSIEYQRSEPCTITGNTRYLLVLSGHISRVWKQVGRSLQIKESIIENIEKDHEGEGNQEKAYQLLLTWTRKLGSNATLHDLINALNFLGRNDIANAISLSNKKQRDSTSSRATEVEMKIHARLQKQAVRKLRKAYQFYQERLREVDDIQTGISDQNETPEVKEMLQELDKTVIKKKLDLIQEQLCKIQEKDQKYSEIDRQLRFVANKLSELDKTFDILDDSQIFECKLNGLCYFRHVKYFRTSSNGKQNRMSSKEDGDIDDDVFQDSSEQEPRENRESKVPLKASFARNTSGRSSWSKLFRLGNKSSSAHPRSHRVQEEHIKRKLRVSITDIDEQFQMEDFVNKFCPKYRQGKPFVFDHCCMNTSLGRSNYGINSGCDIMCPIDESRIIIPSFQSTETIYSLMTNNRTSRGFINETGVWI